MYKIGLIMALLFLVSGCSYVDVSTPTKDINASKRTYKDISKDSVLEATKKLFHLSNKKEFVIDSYRNRVEVSKVIISNSIFNVDLYLDKWVLEVYELENETRANLSLVRTDAMDEVKNLAVPEDLFKLFWDRLDYLLGTKKEWVECSTYQSQRFTLDNTLCSEFFYSDKPKDSDKITNIYISQRSNNIQTIDKLKSIYNQDSNVLQKEYTFKQSENIEDVKVLDTISYEEILEKSQEIIEVSTKEDEKTEDNKTDKSSNASDEKISEDELKKFTENIKNIINNKR